MKRVLLTGISGFVGAHVLEHLLVNTDWKIVGVASWKHKGTPERVEEVLKGDPSWKNRVDIITHDLISPFPAMTMERLGLFDYIINLASESHVDRSIEDPIPFIQNNINLTLNILEYARYTRPDKFIQFSTDEVYGAAPLGVDFPEWSPIVPSNPYSASKAAQEAIAISYWRTYSVPLILTNCMNIFGEMQDSEKYLAKIIRIVSEGYQELVPVHGTYAGGQELCGSRFYLHARNCADAILFILNEIPVIKYQDGVDMRPERFNIVGDVEMDNLSIAKLIAEIMGRDLNYKITDHHSTRPGHDRRYALDGTKLKKAGWVAPLGFRESLEKYIKWTLANPRWI